jgi:hypothetical protein
MNNETHYNHIDSKIKVAADNMQFAYNEAAWQKLEKRLNDTDKKRRIGFWWWLPVLCICIGAALAGYKFFSNTENKTASRNTFANKQIPKTKNNGPTSTTIVTKNGATKVSAPQVQNSNTNNTITPIITNPAKSVANSNTKNIQNNFVTITTATTKSKKKKVNVATAKKPLLNANAATKNNNYTNTIVKTAPTKLLKSSVRKNNIAASHIKTNKKQKNSYSNTLNAKSKTVVVAGSANVRVQAPDLDYLQSVLPAAKQTTKEKLKEEKSISGSTQSPLENSDEAKSSLTNNQPTTNSLTVQAINNTNTQPSQVNKNDSVPNNANNQVAANKINSSTKGKIATANKPNAVNNNGSFYATALFGIEKSSTKFLGLSGPTNTRYAVALGYQFKKINVEVGFANGAKKYTAAGSDYTVKPGSPLSYYNIIGVNANCRVYEIPVTFGYTMYQNANFSITPTVALNSYIMKNELYDYTILRPNGTTWNRAWQYTKNTHFAATLTFGTYFEHAINKQMAIIAQPMVSVPLKGVGEGSIKLQSAALNLGLKYKLKK